MTRPEIVEQICEQLAGGKALAEICRLKGLPSSRTFLRWVDEDESIEAEYRRALVARAEWFNAEHERIRKTAVSRETALAARVQLTALEWQMSKCAPKRYGDRVDVNVHRDGGLAAELDAARARVSGELGRPGPMEVHLLEYMPEEELARVNKVQ